MACLSDETDVRERLLLCKEVERHRQAGLLRVCQPWIPSSAAVGHSDVHLCVDFPTLLRVLKYTGQPWSIIAKYIQTEHLQASERVSTLCGMDAVAFIVLISEA